MFGAGLHGLARQTHQRYEQITYSTSGGTGSCGHKSLVKYDVNDGTYRCQQVCLQVAMVQAAPCLALKIHLVSSQGIWVPTMSAAETSLRIR